MRTTLSLDEDVANSLREQAALDNVSFEQAVNDALRRGLASSQNGEEKAPAPEFVDKASGPSNDPKYYKRILDEEDIQHYVMVRDR